jgi:membrane protein DedA with SNARE-associated domain
MEAYVDQLSEWIFTLTPLSIYLIFGAVAYLENVLPPIPGDLLVAFGGYLAAERVIGFTPLLAITTVASVIGFMTMYGIGAYFGDKISTHRKKFWLMRWVDVKYYDRGKRWMQQWGQGVILANRFLAGTRSVISLTAGMTHTRLFPTIISSAVSSLVWNFILLGLGWIVHENWHIIGDYLNIYGWGILILIVLGVSARILYKWWQSAGRRKK